MAVPGPPTGSSYGPSRLPTCTQTVWNVAVGDPGSTHSSGNDIGNLLIMPTTTSTPENNQYSNEPVQIESCQSDLSLNVPINAQD